MSFTQWISMNVFMDISFLVFAGFVIFKLRKQKNNTDSIKQMREDLNLAMRNPQAAKRALKDRAK